MPKRLKSLDLSEMPSQSALQTALPKGEPLANRFSLYKLHKAYDNEKYRALLSGFTVLMS